MWSPSAQRLILRDGEGRVPCDRSRAWPYPAPAAPTVSSEPRSADEDEPGAVSGKFIKLKLVKLTACYRILQHSTILAVMSPWNVHRFFLGGGGGAPLVMGRLDFVCPHPEIPSAATDRLLCDGRSQRHEVNAIR